jgi:hypothetical protein
VPHGEEDLQLKTLVFDVFGTLVDDQAGQPFPSTLVVLSPRKRS